MYNNEPVPLFADDSTESGFAPVDFSGGLLNQIPYLPEHLIPQVRVSIIDIFVLHEFSSDDFSVMRKEVDILTPLGHAVVIGREGRFFLSARHLFSELSPRDVVFFSPATNEFYDFSVLEDGAQNQLDYLFGTLEAFDTIMPDYPPPMRLSEAPSTVAMITLVSRQEILFSQYQPTQYESLMESSFLSSRETNCGLPWINPRGEMFALHCKRCDSPLFGKQRNGLPVTLILQQSSLILAAYQGRLNYQNSLALQFKPEYFDSFSTASAALGEVEEGGKRRDFALGSTPTVSGWTSTPKQVLFRFFVEGRAKLVKSNKSEVTITELEAQYSNTAKIKKAVNQLIDNDDYKLLWHVKVFKTADDKVKTFVPLFCGDIHMGHILPAVAFWNEGSHNYMQKCFTEINAQMKKGNYSKQYAAKQTQFVTNSLSPYTQSGMDSWMQDGQQRTDYIKKFMTDGNNYEFETESYNLAKSSEEKAKYGTYKVPPGYQWEDVSVTKRKKFKLVPVIPVTYKTWTNLNNAFQIRASNQDYKPVNDFPWLTDTLKSKSRSKTDFVKEELNDKFKLRITRTGLNKKQESAISQYLEEKAKRAPSTIKYVSNATFFHLTCKNTLSTGKVKRNQIYDVAEGIVSSLNKHMKP